MVSPHSSKMINMFFYIQSLILVSTMLELAGCMPHHLQSFRGLFQIQLDSTLVFGVVFQCNKLSSIIYIQNSIVYSPPFQFISCVKHPHMISYLRKCLYTYVMLAQGQLGVTHDTRSCVYIKEGSSWRDTHINNGVFQTKLLSILKNKTKI